MRYLFLSLTTVATVAVLMSAAELLYAAEPSETEIQIRRAATGYLEALNRGDAEQIASFWTPDGVFVDATNQSHHAHKLIKAEFSSVASATEKSEVRQNDSTVRMISADVALERGSSRATANGTTAGPTTTFIALWVKSESKWLLDYLHEFSASSHSPETPLADLAWMVGEWEAREDGIEARVTVTWADQGKFLLQRFTVRLPDQIELRAEQRITWDANRDGIRSWLFRSDGGFAEGEWSFEGDTWVVKKAEVTADGVAVDSVSLWVHDEPDSCWFKSVNRSSDPDSAGDFLLRFQRVR